MTGGARAETRRFGRSAVLLSSGIGLAGLLTYVYFSLASHSLSRQDYGEIVVLWSSTFVAISVLYRPVEQLLSRTISEREARGQPIGEPLRVAAAIQLSIAIASAALALALRGPLQDDLLSGNETLYWILVATIVAFAASFYARGFLAGRRRFGVLAGLLLAESASRAAFALAVAVGIASGQEAVALGIAAAPCLSLLVVPIAFVRAQPAADAGGDQRGSPELATKSRVERVDLPPRSAPSPAAPGGEAEEAAELFKKDPHAEAFTLTRGTGFASAVLLIMLAEQTLLNAGPLIVRATEGAAAAGFIFNVLMVARAPLVLFQGIATSLLPHLTRLRSGGGATGEEAFRLSVRMTLAAIAAFTAFVCLVLLIAGPELMQLAFGDKFDYDRAGLLLVGAGMGLYLSATTLNQAALAQGQARRAAVCWVLCAIGFLAWTLTGALDEFRRVEVGFLAAAAVLTALLYVLYRAPRAHPDDLIAPGSSAELEARLASADEAS
jgi:O-antigen/teichoic acid export membrane protein